MQISLITVTLFFMQILSAEVASFPQNKDSGQSDQHIRLEESYLPFDQDVYFSESEDKVSQDGSSATGQSKIGNVEVTVRVDNIDFYSQWKDEQRKNNPKDNPKEKSNKDKDAPSARISVSWSSDNDEE